MKKDEVYLTGYKISCQICYRAKTKVYFHTPRLNICRNCINEICSAETSPRQAMVDLKNELQENRTIEIIKEIECLERKMKLTNSELNHIKKINANIRQENLEYFIAELQNKIDNIQNDPDVEKKYQEYKTTISLSSPTKSKEVKLIRACNLGLISMDHEKFQRPDENEYDAIKRTIREEDNHQCIRCSKRGKELHVHHIIPLSKFGTNDNRNLVTLCYPCHNKQHPEFKVTKNKVINPNNNNSKIRKAKDDPNTDNTNITGQEVLILNRDSLIILIIEILEKSKKSYPKDKLVLEVIQKCNITKGSNTSSSFKKKLSSSFDHMEAQGYIKTYHTSVNERIKLGSTKLPKQNDLFI